MGTITMSWLTYYCICGLQFFTAAVACTFIWKFLSAVESLERCNRLLEERGKTIEMLRSELSNIHTKAARVRTKLAQGLEILDQ